jgi:hypothetical protein
METLYSKRNRFFFRMRSKIGFRRPGYQETGDRNLSLSDSETFLEKKYGLSPLKEKISPAVYKKNLATLWIMEEMQMHQFLPKGKIRGLEAGCQDFSRLPALRAYFRRWGRLAQILGIEIDAFPILSNLHSRFDIAQYYLSLSGGASEDRYEAGNFFESLAKANTLFAFYPFVSEHPALAWGLPADLGNPKRWVEAICSSLNEEGVALLVHQGPWEQEEFDLARNGYPLTLIERKEVNCPFYPLPHPACASLYRLSPLSPKSDTLTGWKKN